MAIKSHRIGPDIDENHHTKRQVKNASGVLIAKGDIVSITGLAGGHFTVVPALDGGNETDLWVAMSDIEASGVNQYGFVSKWALIDADTTGTALKDDAWLSAADVGKVVFAAPASPIRVGKVVLVAVAGTVYIELL